MYESLFTLLSGASDLFKGRGGYLSSVSEHRWRFSYALCYSDVDIVLFNNNFENFVSFLLTQSFQVSYFSFHLVSSEICLSQLPFYVNYVALTLSLVVGPFSIVDFLLLVEVHSATTISFSIQILPIVNVPS